MSPASLERFIGHDFRLDLLCCLVGKSLSPIALSARLRKPVTAVKYHLKVLEDGNVVKAKEGEGGDTLYAATLSDHPPWVAEAVSDHMDSDRPDFLALTRMMLGMRCDGCERLLRRDRQFVAVYVEKGERQARIMTGSRIGVEEVSRLRLAEKFHRDCYAGPPKCS